MSRRHHRSSRRPPTTTEPKINMMRMTSNYPIVAIALVTFASALVANGQVPTLSKRSKEKLVPGNYGDISDSQGNRWNVQQGGQLGRGSNSMVSSMGQLHVNNQQFYNHSNPMMTADRKEYVIGQQNASQFGGIRVTRRVRVMDKQGCVRYLEIFENPTAQAVTVNAEIRHQMGNQFKQYYSNEGSKNPSALGKKESGFYVIPGTTSSSYKPVAFNICSPGAKSKPRMMVQNQYTFHFYFTLQVPAGQSTVVMHTVSQPGKTKDFSAKNLGKMFKPSMLKSVMKAVPTGFRSRLANFSAGGAFGGLSLLSSTSVEGLGVNRGKSDVVAYGENSRVLGTASCAELKLKTDYGEAVIPFEQVAAFVGGNHGRRGVSRVFLRDGQVYTGKAEASDLRLVMADGTKMKLSVPSLDRLVRKELAGEGKWGEEVSAMIETYGGDRIAISNGAEVIMDAVTPWGPIRFSLDDVLWLSPPEEEPVGHHIEFRDGSRFFAYLVGSALKIRSELYGELEIDSSQVRAVVTSAMLAKIKEQEAAAGAMVPDYDESLQVPHVVLVGGQRIIGRIAAPTIGAVTNAELLELPPENIRMMRSTRDDYEGATSVAAPFVIELWGGSLINGQIKEAVLPVKVREQTWRIPLSDVLEVVSPTPRISDETRQRIAGLIRELGNEEWEVRQAASDELSEYGYMAKALLVEALRLTPDAEVRHRIDQLLNEMP